MSMVTEQLLERIGAELRDIRQNLDRLRLEFPEHPTLAQAIELHDDMNGRLEEAKKKVTRNELGEEEIIALSDRIAAGMKKMVALVASDKGGDAEAKSGPLH